VRALAVVACIVFAIGAQAAGAANARDAFAASARAYLVRADDRTLWAHASDASMAPASLTKLMTALLVIDAVPPDDIVVVSANAARAHGARIGLTAGTRIRAAELVVAMLLASANDACTALAEHAAGSEAAFVARMNTHARALGLRATRFANACGFDAPAHRSSAADLARLADAFLADSRLAGIVAAPARVVHAEDGRSFAAANTNALIGRVPGAIGVKTGYTARAGHCLIGLVERDGVRVLVVLLGARDRWWDAVAMIERAFEQRAVSPASSPTR
jgi:D-alanyl-D-alanine carboxypeptidase (penicillin-binding protein 5/6)